MRTPTISQMQPYLMRSEFFRRVTADAPFRVRLGWGDFLVRLKARMDAKRQKQVGFVDRLRYIMREQGGAL